MPKKYVKTKDSFHEGIKFNSKKCSMYGMAFNESQLSNETSEKLIDLFYGYTELTYDYTTKHGTPKELDFD